jgi:hypothetical protein
MRKAVIEVAEKCYGCQHRFACPYNLGWPRSYGTLDFFDKRTRKLRPLKACRDATLAYSVTWGGARKGKIKGNLKP